MPSEIIFDEERHIYVVDGEIVPSVTQVMQPLYAARYAGIPESTLRRAADRGTQVHAVCELIDGGVMPDLEPFGNDAGYVEAYLRFVDEQKPEWTDIERLVFHEEKRYAGRLDRAGLLGGKRIIADIKTSSEVHDDAAIQMWAYRHALGEEGEAPALVVIHLKKNGEYRVVEFPEREEYGRIFCALLEINRWIGRHK